MPGSPLQSTSRRSQLRWGLGACAGVALTAVALAAETHGAHVLALAATGCAVTAVSMLILAFQQTRLRDLAETDPLTGLAHHGSFHAALEAELAKARRQKRPLALVVVDLDDFKPVNDTHGHPYGDSVLRAIGERVQSAVRGEDIAARIGGDEFAILLPDTNGDVAYTVAERVRDAVGAGPALGPTISCSAGIAVYPADAEDGSSLMQLADAALYSAKRAGKRRSRRFDSESVAFSASGRQATEIKRVLSGERLIQPHFQPVVGLSTGKIVGYEALARFPDSPERAPAAWFAQAQACGLGPELEAAAIRAALEPTGREPDTHLAINISPSALATEVVMQALPEHLTDVVIELTEHEAFAEETQLNSALKNLRERGARIALDDAGAGYAGLKQVVWVRPDIVKLDRDLISAVHADAPRMALIESFVRFARRVGATVCAEGIESIPDLMALADLDVAWGQGFALGRPGPAWPAVSDAARGACRSALDHALRSSSAADPASITAGDRHLENLSARLGSARSKDDLYGALGLIAAELNADKVCLSRWHPDRAMIETLAESGEQPDEEWFAIDDYPLSGRVIRNREAAQVVVSDPDADSAEVALLLSLGYRSLLMVPVVHRDEVVGIVEAHSAAERSWTRTEINRARIISNQFASVIESMFGARDPDRR